MRIFVLLIVLGASAFAQQQILETDAPATEIPVEEVRATTEAPKQVDTTKPKVREESYSNAELAEAMLDLMEDNKDELYSETVDNPSQNEQDKALLNVPDETI
ncbi:hypothetical protein Ciccas_012968 [Cichlidogyrus casuarinus]|uniref:Uncharacterized protein n=1 Tax=Cichlidogyrus casuarinus TaxID=1844966 RepID=A0ABD2PMK4_9PLAT